MRDSTGFTVIELMVTVAVAAILASVALPSYSQFINGQRLDAAARDISNALVLTRSEAIKRNSEALLVDGGGVLLVTTNTARTAAECNVANPPADCIRLQQISDSIDISVDPSGTTQIAYNRSGRANTSITLTLCPDTSSASVKERTISIGTTGLPDISHGGDC